MSHVSIFSTYYINFTNLSLTFLLYLCFLPLNVQKSVHIYHCVRFLDIFGNSLMIEQTACTNVIPDANGRNDCRIRDCRTDDRLHHAHDHDDCT